MALREAEKTVKVAKALPFLGISRFQFNQMLEQGFFTEHRPSKATDLGYRSVFVDEIERYQQLVKEQLPRKRILNGMKQHRYQMGRLEKK